MGMPRRSEDPKHRAVSAAIKAKRNIVTAITERVNQPEAFNHAKEAAYEAITTHGASETQALIAAGDAYFKFIKETCGVENR